MWMNLIRLENEFSDGFGSKNFDPGWVTHLQFGFEFGKFPLKCQFFQFFTLWVKKNLFGSGQKVAGSKASRPLIYCESKVRSGQGPSLENVDQKYKHFL